MDKVKNKKFKENSKCWVVWINPTFNYTSFKVEKCVYLGTTKFLGEIVNVVEFGEESVDYVDDEKLFNSEKGAYEYLIKQLQNKIKK